MIDLHCHILPKIDDGARDLEAALKMAAIAVEDGVETIVATPHVLDLPILMKEVESRIAELASNLSAKQLALKILPGAEVSIFAFSQIKDIKEYTINKSDYILVEFPYLNIPDYFDDILFNIAANGLKPILAHPERNPEIIKNPSRLKRFLKNDTYVQITAASITGVFGTAIKKCSEYLLENDLVTIVATDAHSTRKRPPILSNAYDYVKNHLDSTCADYLFKYNPEAVISNKKIDHHN